MRLAITTPRFFGSLHLRLGGFPQRTLGSVRDVNGVHRDVGLGYGLRLRPGRFLTRNGGLRSGLGGRRWQQGHVALGSV